MLGMVKFCNVGGVMVDYCTKVDKIISSIPELEDNVEARAIVSHVLLNIGQI